MNNIKNIAIALLCIGGLQAQSIEREVLSSGGETLSNAAVTLDFTVGELAVTDIANEVVTLQQGFHQTRKLFLKLSPMVFLEGPSMSQGGTVSMVDDLRQANVIPLTSPFPDAKVAQAAVFNETGSNAIVDWIYISLMDKNDRTITLASTSAFLQVDGDVVDVNGVKSVEFDIDEDDYFVRVVHRNHLAILTSNPITLSLEETLLDLTSDPLAIFGGVNAVNEVGGAFAMVSGDVVSNGQVQFEDSNAVLQQLGAAGYTNEDTDLSGQIQFADFTLFTLPNLGRGVQF